MKRRSGSRKSLPNLQQGDVLIRGVARIPEAARPKKGRAILAFGEVTGHCHEAIGDGVEVFERDGVLYLSAPKGCTVQHEEHKAIAVPPGDYQIGIVREYDHFAEEARAVQD